MNSGANSREPIRQRTGNRFARINSRILAWCTNYV